MNRPDHRMLPGYTLLKTISTGLTGNTELVFNEQLREKCILKTLSKNLSKTSSTLFRREIDLISSLDHPHIVRVLDHGETEEFFYLTMEYMECGSLSDQLEKGVCFDVQEVIEFAITLCQVLVFLNKKKIVHRDIKPSNIFMSANEIIKLGDFGLAKDVTFSGKSGITAPGSGRGTLEYISLEQLENAVHADCRSDIYSFGASLYHLLCGCPPHQGQNTFKLITDIMLNKPVPLRDLNPNVPEAFEELIVKTLSKKPSERYQNPQELLIDLYKLN